MSDYYYGKTGKDYSWGLLSDKRIVVKQKGGPDAEWRAFESIAEADEYFRGGDDQVLFWENGEWKEVHFLLQSGKAKVIKGFSQPS